MNISCAIFSFCKAFLKVVGKRAYLMGIGNKLVTALGKRDGVIDALKKETVKLVLELFYLKGDG